MVRNSTITSFGSWVRNRRRLLDLTQSELGKRVACSEATIRKIEADERKPSAQLAELLAKALSIPPDDFQRFLKSARGVWLEDRSLRTNEFGISHNNLPALLTSTIDRVQDHAAVTALLRDKINRLVTIIGPPGIGKTRLSIHCGKDLLDDFPDGVWFVDLSEVRNPLFFASAIARVLSEVDLPPSPDLVQLIRGLKHCNILLILDNFEQIVDGAAQDVVQILQACPKIKLLVTSRQPLNIYGENEYPLPPLTTPPLNEFKIETDLYKYESVQLFVARARLHQPHFSINAENTKNISEICTILEGIPLAIELAAATLRQKTLDEINMLLHGHDWTGQIGTSARDLPQRQRSLENVIEWSIQLLNDEEKSCYARLGVLSGWFDVEAASTICESDIAKVKESLDLLTEQSLLFRNDFAGHTHWRMLELIRAHAYSKLAEPDSIELIRARYYVEKIKNIRQSTLQTLQEDYITRQLANLHGALTWAIADEKTTLALQLVIQLENYWFSLGYLKEGLDFCRQLFRLIDTLGVKDRLRLLQISSDLGWQQHDFDSALFFLQEQGKLAREGGFTGEYPLYLNRLGRIFIEQGKLTQAKEVLNEALRHVLDDGSTLNSGIPLVQLGEIALFEGDPEKAGLLFHQALSQLDPKDAIFLAMARTDLAEIALANMDLKIALSWLKEAFEPAQNHIRRLIIFLCTLSGFLVLSPTGNIELAARFYGAIDKLCETSGTPLGDFYQITNRQRIGFARQELSLTAWQAVYGEGQTWNKEDAIRFAELTLNQLDEPEMGM